MFRRLTAQRLSAKFSVGSYFAGHACYLLLRRTTAVDPPWVLMASLAAEFRPRHIYRNFAGEIATATAVATSAMLRTWPVKLLGIEFTESVRSSTFLPHLHLSLPAEFAVSNYFPGTPVTSAK